jgi:hypothetical protein
LLPFTFSGDFKKTGFTIIELKDESLTKDWRTNVNDKKSDMKSFTDDLEDKIRKLYPDVKEFMWLENIVRGGEQSGDFKPAFQPHLDFHQNKSLIMKYHSQVESPKFNADYPSANPILMGEADNENRTFSK